MSSIPKIIVSTDWHLKPSNLEEIYKLQEQEVQEANKLGITSHVWLGDIFDSRISQREETLRTFTKIIELYNTFGHKVYCVPGNHDKSNYDSETSFLDSFKYHPNFVLIDQLDFYQINGINCYFLPFFSNEIWLDEISNQQEQDHKNHILFTHIAFQGSRNNDGSLVESTIKPSMFENWGMVYSGHYHDFQELTENVIHLGSLTQNNFGEDENKGFWVIYDDLSYDLIPSQGKSYKKLTIDLQTITSKQADKLIKSFKKENEDAFIRVEFKGNQDELKAIDKKVYQELGIDVKLKATEVEDNSNEVETSEVKALTNSDIIKKFKDFCNQNEYDYREGLTILEQVL